jgi:hypothetical protein
MEEAMEGSKEQCNEKFVIGGRRGGKGVGHGDQV